MNAIYGTYFKPGEHPSRVVIQVADLPRSSLIGIEIVAAISSDKYPQ